MAVLGIDYGLSRIGLALAENNFVRPLGVVKNSSSLMKQLAVICQENQIKKIVIGLPEGKVALKAKQFAYQLRLILNLPVVFQDESLTTQEAIGKMITVGIKRKARQKKQDAFAAALILEAFLEKGKNV